MIDHNGNVVHIGEVVKIVNHPEIFPDASWIVLDYLGCTKDFVLQHYLTKEIRIFNSKDVESTYTY